MEQMRQKQRGSLTAGQVAKKASRRRRTRRGERTKNAFTLVEILIVVVILGILAAIVIPQFSEASSESQLNTLLGNLQTVRSQIQLYKVQHNDLFPGQAVIGGDVVAADFVSDLTDPAQPYLHRFPSNHYISDSGQRAVVTCVNDVSAAPTGAEGTGWWFNAANGDFRAASSDHLDY